MYNGFILKKHPSTAFFPLLLSHKRTTESFNNFSNWLRFGTSDYIVSSNDPEEQEKAVKYNCLLANAVILQNLVDMTNILIKLAAENYDLKEEEICKLSPYITNHIKRFGDYRLDVKSTRFIPASQEFLFKAS